MVSLAPERFRIEVWTKVHGETIYFGVRADTDRWIGLLLKNFEHHGMIGDFNDAKLFSLQGVEDYFVASHPRQTRPGPRLKAGVHT